MTEAPPIAELRGVSRQFPRAAAPALDNVTLRLAAGARLLLTGPSGSGKSTLVHVLGALESIDRGEVHLAGTRIDRLSEGARAALRGAVAAVVFQGHLLPGGLTAEETVAAPLLWLREARPREALGRARALLEALGLAPHRRQRVETLSGGQRQRVAIARALVAEPALLLADEPTAQLDPGNAAMVLEILLRWQAEERGRSLLLVSHDPLAASAARWDRCLSMERGCLREGTTAGTSPRT